MIWHRQYTHHPIYPNLRCHQHKKVSFPLFYICRPGLGGFTIALWFCMVAMSTLNTHTHNLNALALRGSSPPLAPIMRGLCLGSVQSERNVLPALCLPPAFRHIEQSVCGLQTAHIDHYSWQKVIWWFMLILARTEPCVFDLSNRYITTVTVKTPPSSLK